MARLEQNVVGSASTSTGTIESSFLLLAISFPARAFITIGVLPGAVIGVIDVDAMSPAGLAPSRGRTG